MKTINIDGKEYKIKRTIRSLFVYERVFGRTMTISSTEDTFMYLWSTIKANNEDAPSYEEFLDWIDEAPSARSQLIIQLMGEMASEDDEMHKADDGKKKAKIVK